MNIYSTIGEKFESIESFLSFYEKIYFYEGSFIAENRIDRILQNGIQSRKDAYDILAWKLNGINKNITNSDSAEKMHYNGEKWLFDKVVNQKKLCQGTYQGGIIHFISNENDYLDRFVGKGEIGKSLEKMKRQLAVIDELEENEANEIAADALNLLAKDAPKGMGPVYLITLLYFITNGKRYPIYDKFAHLALRAILNDEETMLGNDITDDIISKDFPPKADEDFGQKVMNIKGKNTKYKEYMRLIDQFEKKTGIKYYADDNSTNRRVDRALWAYGHMFNLATPVIATKSQITK